MADEFELVPDKQQYELVEDKSGHPPKALLERLAAGEAMHKVLGSLENRPSTDGLFQAGNIASRVGAGIARGFGDEPLGISDRLNDVLTNQIPIFNKPGEGVSPLRFANEAMLRPVAAGVDFVFRAMNAGAHGIGGLVGGIVKETTGDETEASKAEKDVASLVNIAGLVGGSAPPMVRVRRGPGVADETIGQGLPKAPDFEMAARVIADGENAPAVAAKLERLYQEHGMLPAEIAADAATNHEVKTSLLARGDRLPEYYTGPAMDAAKATPEFEAAFNRVKMDEFDFDPRQATSPSERAEVVKMAKEAAVQDGQLLFRQEAEARKLRKSVSADDLRDAKFIDESRSGMSRAEAEQYRSYEEFLDKKDVFEQELAKFRSELTEVQKKRIEDAQREVDYLKSSKTVDFAEVRDAAEALAKEQLVGVDAYPKYIRDLRAEAMALADVVPEAVREKFAQIKEAELRVSADAQKLVELEQDLPNRREYAARLADAAKVAEDYVAFVDNQSSGVALGRGTTEPVKPRQIEPPAGGGGGKPPGPPRGKMPGGDPAPEPLRGASDAARKGDIPEHVVPDIDAARAHMDSRLNLGEEGRSYSMAQFQADWVNKVYAIEMAGGDVKPYGEGAGSKDFLRNAIDNLTGRPLEAAVLEAADHPGALARLYSGVAGKVQAVLEDLKGQGGPQDFFTSKRIGKSFEAIMKPVEDAIPEFRRFIAAARAAELEGRNIGTGVNMEAAKVIVEANKAKMGKPMLELVNFQNQIAMYLRDSGVLSAKGYAAMVEANKLYVPFHRVFRVEGRTIQGAGDSLQASNPINKIKGSGREIVDPLQTIIKNTYTMIAMAEKNVVSRKLVDTLLANESGRVTPLKEQPGRKGSALAKRADDGEVGPVREGTKPKSEIETINERGGEVDKGITDWLKREGVDDPNMHLATMIDDITRPPGEDTIRVFRDGVAKDYRVDPDIARAMKNLDAADIGVYERFLAMPASSLRAGSILNPIFWMKHLMREPFGAAANFQRGLFTPLDMARGLKSAATKDEHFVNWLRSGGGHTSMVSLDRNFLQKHVESLAQETGLFTRAWNVVVNPEATMYQKSGAVLGLPIDAFGKFVLEPSRAATEIVMSASHLGAYRKVMRQSERYMTEQARADMAAKLNEPTLLPSPEAPPSPLREQGLVPTKEGPLGDYGQELYMGSRDRKPTEGVPPEEGSFGLPAARADTQLKRAMLDAAYISRETSMDNARTGAKMRGINMIFAFANARVQDMARLGESMAARPAQTTAVLAGSITIPSLLLFYAQRDDNGKLDSRVEALPRWQRDTFWVIPTDKWEPTTADRARVRPNDQVRIGSDGQYYVNNGALLRYPKPFAVGMIFGTGPERLMEQYFDQNPHAWKDFAKSMGDTILGEVVMPTGMAPIYEQGTNRRLYNGAPVIPSSMEKGLPEYQYTPYTTETSKAIGMFMSQLPGVSSHRLDKKTWVGQGAAAISSPMLIEHYVRGWSGGLGMMTLQALDMGLRKAGVVPDPENRPDRTLADIPFVQAFVARHPSASSIYVEDFYEKQEAANKVYTSWISKVKQGDIDAATFISSTNATFLTDRLKAYQTAIQASAQTVKWVHADPKMPGSEKRQLIDDAYFAMTEMAKQGLEMARDLEKTLTKGK